MHASQELLGRITQALDLPDDYFIETRLAIVVDHLSQDPALVARVYASLPKNPAASEKAPSAPRRRASAPSMAQIQAELLRKRLGEDLVDPASYRDRKSGADQRSNPKAKPPSSRRSR
jgi:hypothetical protein